MKRVNNHKFNVTEYFIQLNVIKNYTLLHWFEQSAKSTYLRNQIGDSAAVGFTCTMCDRRKVNKPHRMQKRYSGKELVGLF